jgi:hypothetical protein
LAIQVSDGFLLGWISDHHKAPVLLIAPGRGLQGYVDGLLDHLWFDRSSEVEPSPHTAGRCQDMIDHTQV